MSVAGPKFCVKIPVKSLFSEWVISNLTLLEFEWSMIIINMEVLYGGSSQTSMMVRVAEIVNNEKPLMFVQSKLLELGCELGSLIAFKIKLKDSFLRAVYQIPVSAYHQISPFLLQKAQNVIRSFYLKISIMYCMFYL